MPLYESLGFTGHPFAKTNADEEPNLKDYFVPPGYFDAIIGDSGTPTSSVVLAPRGAGKTAQRRMVEDQGLESLFLSVTYDRFEFSGGGGVADVSLQYHLRNIITRIIVSFLSYLSEYPDIVRSLSKQEKLDLSLFIQTYLGSLTGDKIQELMKELRSLPEKFKTFWKENVGFMESVVNFLLRRYDLDPIDLPDVKHEEKRLAATYKYQLETLLGLVKRIGFNSIYILIDKVDETEQTGNNPEQTYQLIQPLIRDLELLGLEGYAFKFFLWNQVEPFYRKHARPDRIAQYELHWSRADLKGILSARLKAFSSSTISSFGQLVMDGPGIDIDDAICVMSNGSPRNMIRMCERILAVQGEISSDSEKIEFRAVDRGILTFSEMLFLEIYGNDILRDMQRVGRELFTTNYIANDVLKISGQGARNKITGWANTGLIQQVGTVTVPPARRPVNFYCVVDPIAVRLMHRTTGLERFFKDRWLPCNYCNTDNLVEINLYPPDNEAVCRKCGRLLIS
jgi:hypothetical protein